MTLNTFFGDIHNHNAMGYGLGSLERSIEIARSHLDFFAFTGHSSWHDMDPMEGGRERHWLDGFERLEKGWPKVQSLIAESNQDGTFSSFLGFEWHSSRFGDQCVIFPDDHQPLCFADHVGDLRRFCVDKSAIMIPHHLAYPTGVRGVNWGVFEEACTPVVEIFSEHGNSENDRGPFPYFNHSMGGRVTANTARAALDKGMRFGFVASSDNHRGFPGAYGEGIMAVLCPELSRQAIFEAINARRTYALTGDRIDTIKEGVDNIYDLRWGWIFSIKMTLVLVMVALVAFHSYVLGPRLMDLNQRAVDQIEGGDTRIRRLQVQSGIVAALGLLTSLLVLGCGAFLSNSSFSFLPS